MHDRVGAPRAPLFGSGEHRPLRRLQTQSLESLADTEVAGHERIRVAERAHRDVGEGPRSDPRHVTEPPERLLGRCVARKIELTARDQRGDAADRLGSRPGHPERLGRELGHARRRWEEMGDPRARTFERRPGGRHQSAERRPRPRDGHLLSEDRAHDELEAVERSGDADPGDPGHQRGHRRIRGERGVDREGVGVEVERSASAIAEIVEVG